MKGVASLDEREDFFAVTGLDSQTKSFILRLPDDKRYLLNNTWHVHKSALAEVIKKAKSTGLHKTIDYSDLPKELQTTINNILYGKVRPKLSIPKSIPINHYAALHLLPSAPIEVVNAAYKILVLKHHPDRDGDPETFLKIQKAFEVITGENR